MNLKGPVLIELCRSFDDDLDRLDTIADADLYRDIVFAVRLRYSTHDFSAQPAPHLDEVASRILDRLHQGWFADLRLVSPQARFAEKGTIGNVAVGNSSDSVLGDKPTGALWTSSYLPTGHSTWELLEQAEFSHRNRSVFSVYFTESETLVYTIDSLVDYRQLVEQYFRPLPEGRACVQWSAMARDFHAVRLSVRGLVTVHDVEFETPHGVACLRGWESECTAWLRRPPDARIVANPDYRPYL